MDKIKGYIIYGSITIIIGIAIGYFLLKPKAPDVKITDDKISIENKQLLTQVSELKTQLKQEIAKNVITTTVTHKEYRENGTLAWEEISNKITDLTTINSDFTASQTVFITIKGETLYKERITEKQINYTGSAFVLYDPLQFNVWNPTIGCTYTLYNPFSIIAQYAVEEKKLKVGVNLAF